MTGPNTDRVMIDSLKGALRPSLLSMAIDKRLLSVALKELSEEVKPNKSTITIEGTK